MESSLRGYYTIRPDDDPEREMFIGDLRLAYLDPGTGSLIIQGLIAAAAGAAVTLRLYWRRFKRFFGAAEDDAEDPETRLDSSVDG